MSWTSSRYGGNKKHQSENLQGTYHFEEVGVEGKIILKKKDRKCRYKVTLRCVSVTAVAVESIISNKYSECVFIFLSSISSMQSACAELYCHM